MVKNNRVNDEDLREGQTEKARLNAEEAANEVRNSNAKHGKPVIDEIGEHEHTS